MKRCPECEFIYEDDQDLCDMDGNELAHESRWFPLQPGATSELPAPAKSRWRSLTLLVALIAVLATVLFIDYYNFRHGTARVRVGSQPKATAPKSANRNSTSEESVGSSAPNQPATPTPATRDSKRETWEKTAPSPGKPVSNSSRIENASEAVKPASAVSPTKAKLEAAKPPLPSTSNDRANSKQKPAVATHRPADPKPKKQSRFSSFLKKTGRILKKPFQL